jgi:hypothetical protein
MWCPGTQIEILLLRYGIVVLDLGFLQLLHHHHHLLLLSAGIVRGHCPIQKLALLLGL